MIKARAFDEGTLVVETDGVTLDFSNKWMAGSGYRKVPDERTGRAVVIRNAKNVTVKDGSISGFKIAIYAENCPGLTIENCDVSNNYRQRLKSTPQRENEDDWLYGHENDKNEWLRYGAGIYLYKCDGATIRNCRARNGQNGICLVNCNDATVVGNDMSFMSGWGLAMWRSNRCKVIGNRFDYCVRGYSHGVYARGQDSTGILVYEQCSDNVFAYNHATHGGDGFFLYAGNETVTKTGEGGCNRNLVYMNDFSYGIANGIEATFSDQNIFMDNTLHHCEHGVWGGYSRRSQIQGNDIADCTNGVSIEHGRNNAIVGNRFNRCKKGIWLWWDDDDDLLKSAYAKSQGAESRDEYCDNNSFVDCRVALLAKDVKDLSVKSGTSLEKLNFVLEGSSNFKRIDTPTDFPIPRKPDRQGTEALASLPGIPEGKEFIFIDEWGPYDFTQPRVWPAKISGWSPITVNILGPPGTDFKIEPGLDPRVEITPATGKTPATVSVAVRVRPDHPPPEGAFPFKARVRIGDTSHEFSGTLLHATWTTWFYEWTKETDPRGPEENWNKIIASNPFSGTHGGSLDYAWSGGGPKAVYEAAQSGGEPRIVKDHFAVVARTQINLPAGKWTIRTISDDGLRVFVDDKKVIDNWTWHVPTEDKAELTFTEGPHSFRVEYFEIDGHAQLQLFLEPNESR